MIEFSIPRLSYTEIIISVLVISKLIHNIVIQLTVKSWLFQDLHFADAHVVKGVDALAGLLNIFADAVWDPAKKMTRNVTEDYTIHKTHQSYELHNDLSTELLYILFLI